MIARRRTVPARARASRRLDSPARATLRSGSAWSLPPPVVAASTFSPAFAFTGRTRQKTRMFPLSSCTWLCSARRTMAFWRISKSFACTKASSLAHRASSSSALLSFSSARLEKAAAPAAVSESSLRAAANAELCSSCVTRSASRRDRKDEASDASFSKAARFVASSSASFSSRSIFFVDASSFERNTWTCDSASDVLRSSVCVRSFNSKACASAATASASG